ncbi:TPA: hypothetical protein L4R04_004955 [Pseudomonas aeruginosa]|uniref:hypothetical protein n=1 Tax=Pseudomonas aeruginosa TaxID=287 RepID=UPI00300C41F5|nr:hypothetical protein [Pseudomonas aeruginosa]HCF1590056.1 hypothetical protein [Pseudomonas aeruginosa]
MMKYSMSGFVDESVPDLSGQLEGLQVDHGEFTQWLGILLGRYRFDQVHKFPNARTEKDELGEYLETLQKMIRYTSHGGLPPVVHAEFDWQALNAGINPFELNDSLRKSLTYALVLAEKVQAKARHRKSPRGAPKKTSRDSLLAELVLRLEEAGATATDARDRAEKILVACRVEVPAGERAVRRAQNRKGGGNKSK